MNRTKAMVRVAGLAFVLSTSQISVFAESPCAESKVDETIPAVTSMKNQYGHKALKVRIKINATPKYVWEAVRENRLADPDVQYSKITQINECQKTVEQKYHSIPIFGATTCVMRVDEQNQKRIDFILLKSDRLAEFEGSWELIPSADEKSTTLELSNHLKLNAPIPQKLVDAFAAPKMKARVLFVKELAESKQQVQIAAKN